MLKSTVLNRASFLLNRLKHTLVVVEHDNQKLNPITLNTITAAKKIPKNETVTCLVVGTGCGKVAEEAAKIEGVNKVLVSDSESLNGFLPETVAPLIAESQKKLAFSHIAFGSTAFGKNLMPRVAALLDVQPVSDIIGIEDENTFVRTIYAGNAIQTVKSKEPVKILSVRGTSFEPAKTNSSSSAEIAKLDVHPVKNDTSTFAGLALA